MVANAEWLLRGEVHDNREKKKRMHIKFSLGNFRIAAILLLYALNPPLPRSGLVCIH